MPRAVICLLGGNRFALPLSAVRRVTEMTFVSRVPRAPPALLGVMSVNWGLPLGLAIVLVLIWGTIVGLLGGTIRAFFGVPTFIITLALYLGLRGFALLITNAFPIGLYNDQFTFWGAGRVGNIPVPALLLVAVFVIIYFISTRTAFGRSVYAVGGNAEAARLSGLPVARIRMTVLGITGFLAAVVGILESSRLSAGDPSIAVGLEFDCISAVIIGGTSLFGGRGTMFGTLLGVLLITILTNGMILVGINPYAQQVGRGGVVLGAVLASRLRNWGQVVA